ncbi:HAD-IA family hydrolase [uncultured Bacteroides sp.]|uniref:HAD-IA family hydrolase n=1 Tax=uncultured Bacteroides sp. TaxID=162156 RepID=UPI002622ACAF|nr:HAD-IA family hydrolase [uncultured Bacteroides sp.]
MLRQAIDSYLATHNYNRIDLKAVLFDMDGVLFDSMKNHATAWHEAMKRYDMHLSREEAYMHEGRTGASTINIVSIRQRQREATEEEIKEIYQTKSEIFNSLPKAERMPGAYELLKQVKACGLIPMVVTGSGQKTLLERLNRNFPDIFKAELMVTAFDVKYGKPNPEPYLMALQKGGIKANEAIVVENAPLGVRAGVAAGIFTVAVNTGPLPDHVLLDEGANYLFHSMTEFSEKWNSFYQEYK